MDPVSNTSPAYYRGFGFGAHVEVRDISAHLTSFGGQAVQYIARSTRLDGRNKAYSLAGQIEDLQKAIMFLGWEIDRLRIEDDRAWGDYMPVFDPTGDGTDHSAAALAIPVPDPCE